ncbi:hypothetical protein EOD42_03115 [Rhodovarius crocodyli]|uniref:DUF1902 domain-containing protein n=1 Tax=Rhodovarius crocodyli TaxID=1979269 RepID=A0A437MNB7_9PROT|nr:hypothetical protein [Rhodovarius crocodyli]RVT99112.1 hypothetical protein EOD42_03115 [Rhodovarius crocodyli]
MPAPGVILLHVERDISAGRWVARAGAYHGLIADAETLDDMLRWARAALTNYPEFDADGDYTIKMVVDAPF